MFKKGQVERVLWCSQASYASGQCFWQRSWLNCREPCLVKTWKLKKLSVPSDRIVWVLQLSLTSSSLFLWLYLWQWHHSLTLPSHLPMSKWCLMSYILLFLYPKVDTWLNLGNLISISRADWDGYWRASWLTIFLQPDLFGAWNCYY